MNKDLKRESVVTTANYTFLLEIHREGEWYAAQ
jgi:hypothetical protein